jgi:hypothetical protein
MALPGACADHADPTRLRAVDHSSDLMLNNA